MRDMELFERIKPDFQFSDQRGALVQLVHQGYEQVNVLTTKAGVTRGGHYHKLSTEAFFVVSGQVTVEFKKDAETQTETFTEGDFFRIPPFVSHTMSFPEDTVLVAMYDRTVEKSDGTKDIYAEGESPCMK